MTGTRRDLIYAAKICENNGRSGSADERQAWSGMAKRLREIADRSASPVAGAEELRDLMARAMCPDEWVDFDAGGGNVTNAAGWACVLSVTHANRAYKALQAAGVDLPPPPDAPRQRSTAKRAR